MSDMALIMAAAGATTEAPSQDGALYSWGFGDATYRKLGDAVTSSRSSPVQVGVVTTWSALAVAENTVLGIQLDGTLWAWGNNSAGTAGKGTTGTIYSVPSQVGALTNWASVSGKYNFVAALKTDGSLWTWGYSLSGQGGRGNTTSTSSPNQVGSEYFWNKVETGAYGCMAIRYDGTLWAWGLNNSGCIALGATVSASSPTQVGADSDWFSISLGEDHGLGIRTDGTLWAWGGNTYGQLGTGNTTSRSSPVQVGALTDWVFVSAGMQYSHAIKSDGTLWAFGRNGVGQLGTGNLTSRSSPVQVGALTTWRWISANLGSESVTGCSVQAIMADGTLWAWGSNGQGQFGDGSTVSRSSPVQIGAETDWTLAFKGGGVLGATAGATTFGIRNENGAPPPLPNPLAGLGYMTRVAGDNTYGNLAALSSSFPILDSFAGTFYLSGISSWKKIAFWGGRTTFGISSLSRGWSVGSNTEGLLGTDDPPGLFPAYWELLNMAFASGVESALIDISASHAVSRTGKLYAWGPNTYGQLGTGNTTSRSSPVQVGALTTWRKVAGNGVTSAAIKNDGTLWMWGLNDVGQLGQGNTTDRSSPVQVGALTNWLEVHVGADQTITTVMAIKTDGTLWGWGYNADGRIGDGSTLNRSSPVQIGALTTWRKATLGFALRTDNSLWQLGSALTQITGTWLDVASSGEHQLGVKSDGTLWAWGVNDYGQLGLGDQVDRSSPTQVSHYVTARQVFCSTKVSAVQSLDYF